MQLLKALNGRQEGGESFVATRVSMAVHPQEAMLTSAFFVAHGRY